MEKIVDRSFFNSLYPDFSFGRRIFKNVLLLLSLFFILIALLRPQWGFELRDFKRKGIDLFVLVDTSDSMRAEDLKPSRLERAKRKLKDLVNYLNGDRIGLIPFSGKAFVTCPLTGDYDAFSLFVDNLDTDNIPLPGTNISMAIDKALASFSTEPNRNKAIILITDGEDHSDDLDKAILMAKEKGVKIYVMGLGTPDGAPIPLKDGNGFKADKNGQIVLSKLEERQLQKIALDTGGSYVRSVTSDRDIEEIYLKGIKSSIEGSESKSTQRQIPLERFQVPLFLAVLFLLLEPLIFEIRRVSFPRRRESRKSWIPAYVGMTSAGLLFLFSFSAHAFSFWDKEQGSKYYEKQEYPNAQKKYEQALQSNPNDAEAHYNLGNTFYRTGKYLDADQHYLEALNSDDAKIREFSLYNLGNSAYRQGHLQEAVDYYNKALSVNEQNDKAQKNRDFVLQKMQEQEKQKPDDQNKKDKENKEDQNQQQQNQEKDQPAQDQKNQAQENKQGEQQQDQQEAQPKQEKNSEKNSEELKPSSLTQQQAQQFLDSLEDNPQGALKEMMLKEGGASKKVEEDW